MEIKEIIKRTEKLMTSAEKSLHRSKNKPNASKEEIRNLGLKYEYYKSLFDRLSEDGGIR